MSNKRGKNRITATLNDEQLIKAEFLSELLLMDEDIPTLVKLLIADYRLNGEQYERYIEFRNKKQKKMA